MFTGLVQEIGRVRAVERSSAGAALVVQTGFGNLTLGESIAVDGCCLTVATIVDGGFRAEASAETLSKTTLGELAAGRQVHLERALSVSDRMGGHIVTGHVDGVGRVVELAPLGDSLRVVYEVPEALAPMLAPKGSVAVDGTSLTVNHASGVQFDVVLVPFTRTATTLGRRRVGDRLNIEVDVLAKYVARLLGRPGVDGVDPHGPGGVTLDLLSRQGYL